MQKRRLKTVAEAKAPSIVRREEEARQVIEEANEAAAARLAAKEKVKAEEQKREAAAKARSEERARIRAEEEARIEAAGTDEWYYLLDGDQVGPLTALELRDKIADPSIEPPVNMVWTEGMESWKPFYDMRILCEPIDPNEPRTISRISVVQEIGAAEKSRLVAAKEKAAGEEAAINAKEEARIAAAEREKADDEMIAIAKVEAKLKVLEEARIAAEARAAHEAKLRATAEAKAMADATARLKAEEELILKAEARLKVIETARQLAEAKAAEEASLRAAAEEKAAREAKLREQAEAKAAEEARIAAIAKAKAKIEEQARAKAEAEARLKVEAEAKLRKAMEEKAAEEARLAAAAKARAKEEEETREKAEAEARRKAAEAERAIAEAKAAEETKFRKEAEAKAAEEALIAIATKARAKEEEDARARAESEAKLKAAEEGRKIAEARAEEEEKLRHAAEARAIEESRLRADAESKAATDAKLNAGEDARESEEKRALAKVETRSRTAEKFRTSSRKSIVKKPSKARTPRGSRPKEILKSTAPSPPPLETVGSDEPQVAEVIPPPSVPTVEPVAAVSESPPETSPASDSKKKKPSRVSAKTGWFYTCEGDRLGPVSFAELKIMAAESMLDPRLDMVWRKSMEIWQPAGQIEGLFDKQKLPTKPRETLAPVTGPIRPTRKAIQTTLANERSWPGARRRSLILVTLVLPFAWQYALLLFSPYLIKEFGAVTMSGLLPLAKYVPVVALAYFWMKRLVNLGMSRVWLLAMLAPVLNLWLGYRCFACPPGYAYHKKLDGTGIALAILYGMAMTAAILLAITLLGGRFGFIDSNFARNLLQRLAIFR